MRREPPDADPHVRWWGAKPPDPIHARSGLAPPGANRIRITHLTDGCRVDLDVGDGAGLPASGAVGVEFQGHGVRAHARRGEARLTQLHGAGRITWCEGTAAAEDWGGGIDFPAGAEEGSFARFCGARSGWSEFGLGEEQVVGAGARWSWRCRPAPGPKRPPAGQSRSPASTSLRFSWRCLASHLGTTTEPGVRSLRGQSVVRSGQSPRSAT